MRPWLVLLLLLWTASASAADCLLVYGHGRNVGEPAQNEAWDRLNTQFNLQVTQALQQAGLAAQPLLFKVGVTDVPGTLRQLIAEAERQGCRRVVDTAVFANEQANEEAQTLVVRLRVHPLLGSAGPRLNPGEARIGEALYSGQSEVDLNRRNLERLNLAALAREMVASYLAEQGN